MHSPKQITQIEELAKTHAAEKLGITTSFLNKGLRTERKSVTVETAISMYRETRVKLMQTLGISETAA